MPERVAATGICENIIIGSGLAALAAAKALRARGASFEVIDVGYDLEPERAQAVADLSHQAPKAWDRSARDRLFSPPAASSQGVERRLAFGSDFPYVWPSPFSAQLEDCAPEFSFASGGLANVWGAALLPYSAHALRDWPIAQGDIERSYRNVLSYVPMSGERDGLARTFPLYSDRICTLQRSGQADTLLAALEQRKARLAGDGIEYGRARVAVDSSDAETGCRYCGMCLDGCVYGSLFTPRTHWKDLESAATPVHRGYYALAFEEHDDHTVVSAIDKAGTIRQWRTKRLFLAAGHFGTARLIARSLGRFDEPIRIADSQYFFFPLFSYRPVHEEVRFALAEIFLEILRPEISSEHLHLQIYGMNRIFAHTLRGMLPRSFPLSRLTARFYLVQGYLPSVDSGHLEMQVHRAGETHDKISVKGVENPRARPVARSVKTLLQRHLRGFGIAPPGSLRMVAPGRGFHTGGSFPMGGADCVYASDTLGRPAGLERVHIVDAANFPTIASSTIGLTIMANADRIVRACASLAAD